MPSFVLRAFLQAVVFVVFSSQVFAAEPLDNWRLRNPLELQSAVYGNDLFVVVGENGTILTSKSGETWSLKASGTSRWLRGIAYGKDTFVAVGSEGTILTSGDGSKWVLRSSPAKEPLNSVV